jgi:hypothetical protein
VNGRAAGGVAGDAGTVTVSAAAWPRAEKHRVLVETTGLGDAEPRGWIAKDVAWPAVAPAAPAAPKRTPFAKLVAEAPATVVAGETFVVRALAANADGTPCAGWKGRFELRGTSPPVRWIRADSPTPGLEMPCAMTKAGDYELRVSAPQDGRDATVRVRVVPGPLHHATCPADSLPLGQEADLEVVVEDQFGNRLTDYAGRLTLEIPQDQGATLPDPVPMAPADRGRAVFRRVIATHAGPTGLVLKDLTGRVISLPQEQVNVAKRALRPWLVAGPGTAKELFLSDPGAKAKAEGSRAGKLTFERRADADVVALPAGEADGSQAAAMVTWVEALAPTKARLLAAAAGRVRVLVDGKEVFEGVPKTTDPRGKREPVADLTLAAGVHRLTVVAETKGAASVSFEIDDGKGEFPPTLRVRGRAPEPKK